MKILVTGACGFIGSNFIHYLLDSHPEDNYTIVDKLTYAGDIHNLDDIKEKLDIRIADITDEKTMEELFYKKGFDIVVNMAAETHVDRSFIDEEPFLRTNVLGATNLIKLAKKYHVRRFVQISTDEVYGDLALDSDYRYKETDRLAPSNPYSISKAMADLLCLSLSKGSDLELIITRSTNNYGPYQYPEKLIPLAIDRLLSDKKIPVYGDGRNMRDWIYVLDNVRAIDLLMRKGTPGIYNIAYGHPISNLELLTDLLRSFDKDESYITFVKDRKVHDLRYALDVSKIESLGFDAKITLKEGLKKTVDWYKAHRSYLEAKKDRAYNDYLKKVYEE